MMARENETRTRRLFDKALLLLESLPCVLLVLLDSTPAVLRRNRLPRLDKGTMLHGREAILEEVSLGLKMDRKKVS